MASNRSRGRPRTGNLKTHVMLEPDLLKRVKSRANAEHRNVSNMINVLIRAALDVEETLDRAEAMRKAEDHG